MTEKEAVSMSEGSQDDLAETRVLDRLERKRTPRRGIGTVAVVLLVSVIAVGSGGGVGGRTVKKKEESKLYEARLHVP